MVNHCLERSHRLWAVVVSKFSTRCELVWYGWWSLTMQRFSKGSSTGRPPVSPKVKQPAWRCSASVSGVNNPAAADPPTGPDQPFSISQSSIPGSFYPHSNPANVITVVICSLTNLDWPVFSVILQFGVEINWASGLRILIGSTRALSIRWHNRHSCAFCVVQAAADLFFF